MSFPIRMNLTSVRIRQRSALGAVHADPDFEAPRSGTLQGAEVTLRCQVEYNVFQRRRPTRTGDEEPVNGRLVFSRRYLDRQAVTLQKGDRVTGVRDRGLVFRAVNFRIIEVAPSGHLPNPGLVVAFFQHDREDRATP